MVTLYNVLNSNTKLPTLNAKRKIDANGINVSIEDTVQILGRYFDMYYLNVEHSYVIAFDNHMNILGIYQVSIGNSKECFFYKKSIATFLLLIGAESFVLYHNHPDGNLQPSEKDRNSIFYINLLADTLEIKFIDSVIISKKGWRTILGGEGDEYDEEDII